MMVHTVQYSRHRAKKKAAVFAACAAIVLGISLFGAYLCPYDPYVPHYEAALQPPSTAHWLGTDRYGRDMLSRILVGARLSVLSTLALVAIIAAAGTLAGLLCGYRGGRLDDLLMRLSDICLAFPGLIFAMAMAAVLNGGIENAVMALAVVSWPKYARLVRSRTLALKEQNFIFAAQMAGAAPWQIAVRHILPNCLGTVLVTAALDIGTMMMELAALSFLGLGAKPPAAEWGSMMSTERSMLQTYPWVVLGPGAAIFISVAAFNLLGDALHEYADPNCRRRQKRVHDGGTL